MDLSVFFVGTGGSVPTAQRGLPSVLVRRGGDRILFDCGEGTQRQLLRSIGLADLTEIFLTHFHADHWLGLPGMLKTFDLRDRERPLTVYGPPGLKALVVAALRLAGRVSYDLRLVELEPGDVLERDGYRIAPLAVDHRGTAYGYVMFEAERPGVFDPARARELGLVDGPEFGRVQRGATIRGVTPAQVMGPSRPGRKLVLSGDTRPSDAIRIAAQGADLLIHEATFAEEETDRAFDNGHTTAGQAAEIAREAEVRMLALTHISTRHPPSVIRDEARAIFTHTVVPRDFDTIELPYAERGEPELHRFDERDASPTEAQHAS